MDGPCTACALRTWEKGFVRIVFQQTHRVLGSDVINAGLRAQRPVERAGNTLRPHESTVACQCDSASWCCPLVQSIAQ